MNVCLLNDSFPPTAIDGVANATLNYARSINKKQGNVMVATPKYPGISDSYPFPVIRYSSINTMKRIGYRAGYPFSVKAVTRLAQFHPDIIHTHCPFISTYMARELREATGAPIVFTYHTRFDFDIGTIVKSSLAKSIVVKVLLDNVNACDEVWAVSEGAKASLYSLGYEGDVRVMRNGVDFRRGRAPEERIEAAALEFGIDRRNPVYLFVGRQMWYKGIKIAIDALSMMKRNDMPFTMIFIGDGMDKDEIEKYAEECGIGDCCRFTGRITDRLLLSDFYSMADIFIFPSTYDTNGLVVHEAAASYTPSVLIRGSGASEDASEGIDCFMCEENAESLYETLANTYKKPELVKKVGEGAAKNLAVSWDEVVDDALQRYKYVIDNVNPTLKIRNGRSDKVVRAAFRFCKMSRLYNLSQEIKHREKMHTK